MKKLIVWALILTSASTFAANIRITSFHFVRTTLDGYRSPLAELCGVVEGATSEVTFVKVLVDPKTNKPGPFNTVAGPDGKFCLPVITYTGEAQASALGSSVQALIK